MLLSVLSFLLICAKISLILGEQKPICVVKFEEDPILQIENIETAKNINFPHSSWALCNASDDDENKRKPYSTVSENALTIKGKINEENPEYECKNAVTPIILQNKTDKRILNVGYEIYNSNEIIGEVDSSQSNETVQIISNKTATREKVEYMFSYAIARAHWISILSIINIEYGWYPDYTTKQITYDILNADNPTETITCPYPMNSNSDLFGENDLELKYAQKNVKKRITKDDPDSPDDITVEFLVPKRHLNSYGRQLTACIGLNVLPMWTKISQSSWTKTNDFIMQVAEALGDLQVTAGTTGVLPLKNSKGAITLTFESSNMTLKMAKIMWRVVNYTLTSSRYGTETDFGIVIITHTEEIKDQENVKICSSICDKNGWEVENEDELGLTYCCPVDVDVLTKLKVGGTISPVKKILNFNKLREMKADYEKFQETFLI